jgi:hypothetical protein
MKKTAFLFVALGLLAMSMQGAFAQEEQVKVKMNFTTPAALSGLADWNDITNPLPNASTPLKDENGNSTTFTLHVMDNNFQEVWTNNGVPNCTLYPDVVALSNWGVKAETGRMPAKIQIRGLDDNATYDFNIFGSRASDAYIMVLKAIIDGEFEELQTNFNTSNQISFEGIAPTDGVIQIDISICYEECVTESTGNWAQLGAIVMFAPKVSSATNNPDEFSIKIYNTQSNVTVKGALEGDMVQVYAVDGRMMLQKTISNEKVNVNLEKGIYLVKVVDCTGNQVKKFSKIIFE